MDKSDTIPIDARAAADSADGLLTALRVTVRHLRERFRVGRGVAHLLPVVRPFRTSPIAHLHPCVEVFLQVAGAGEMELVAGRQRFCAGEMVVVPRGVAHLEHPDAKAGTFWNFVLQFQDNRIGFHLAGGARAHGSRIRRGGGVPTAAGARLAGFLNEAIAAVSAGRPGHHPLVHALLLAHLALLDDVLEGLGPQPAVGDPVVAHARLLIAQYLSDPRLSVAWLAQRLHCSPDHLARRFQAVTGLVPIRAITQERLALSRQLLVDPTLGVAEVAYACGFRDPAYFSRVFTAADGVSPRAWRRLRAG